MPGDDRPASQRAADAAGRVVTVPLGVVIETVAGPVLDRIERAGERIDEKRRTRRALRDARDLCLADPTLFAEACAIAFPEFMSVEGGETEATPGRSETGEPGQSGTHPDQQEPGAASASTGQPLGAGSWARLADSLRRHEGLRLEPYRDTGGVWHVCYGHRIAMDKDECEALLASDMAEGAATAQRLVGHETWAALDGARREVLAEMGFATSLATFEEMLRAVRRGDYGTAGEEILDSVWAREVGKGRAGDLATRMRDGDQG